MGKNCKCVVCGLEYHHCSSCGTNDDNWSLNYPESSYCSAECYRKSEEYKKHAPLLLRLWESLSEEQQGLFEEYLDTEDSDEISEWRSKLFLARQTEVEDLSVETVKESLLETYEGFDIFEIKKTREYPNPDLNEVLDRQYHAVSKERGIRLPLDHVWRADKERKDVLGDYNYNAPDHLHYVNLHNIYTVIDLLAKYKVTFRKGKKARQDCVAKAVEDFTEELKPIEAEYNRATKNLSSAQQAKALLALDYIEELKEDE